jgi:hypothetical protein
MNRSGHASLCESCGQVRIVQTTRSRFLLCRLSERDPNYDKYPRQPVLVCVGYEPRRIDPSTDKKV